MQKIEFVEVKSYFGGNAADDFSRTYKLHFSDGKEEFISFDQYTELPPSIPIRYVEDDSTRLSKTADELYS